MSPRHEHLPQGIDTRVSVVPATEAGFVDEPSRDTLDRINITGPRPGFLQRVSPEAAIFFALVSAHLSSEPRVTAKPERTSMAASSSASPVRRVPAAALAVPSLKDEVLASPSEQEGAPSLMVHGFREGFGVNERTFARDLATALGPLMMSEATRGGHEYRLSYSTRQEELSDVYFGLDGHQHAGARRRPRWIKLAHHQFAADGSHDILVLEAALGMSRGHLDFENAMVTLIHEIIHGLGREHKQYFIDRVREGDGIPFPYVLQFFEAARQGRPVNYEHTGDEYRSKLLEVFFLVGEIPSGVALEDAVVQAILDRYQVSEKVVHRDVQEVISWFPSGVLERCLKAYWSLMRTYGIQFEQNAINTRVIQPIREERLQDALSTILLRPSPTMVTRVCGLSTDPVTGIGHPDQAELVHDIREYQLILEEQLENAVREIDPSLMVILHDWKQVVQLVTQRNQYHTKAFSRDASQLPVRSVRWRSREVNRRFTDQDYLGQFPELMREVQDGRVGRALERLPADQRSALIPVLIEYAHAVSGSFALPDSFRERAEHLLVQY